MNRLKSYTQNLYLRESVYKINTKNIMSVPVFSKIILHTTLKGILQEKKFILPSFLALEMICGQKAKKTRSKKFVAGFKIRKDQLLGCKITLRREQMFSFFEKFLTVILPKVRDFPGFSYNALDKNGNLTFGFQNFLLFPELENHYEIFESLNGLQIQFVTSNKNMKNVPFLFTSYQFPFFQKYLLKVLLIIIFINCFRVKN